MRNNIVSWCPELGEAEVRQLDNLAAMPFIFKHVAVMPDCHLGKGATVGSVIATKGAIIPAAVGVDIGCGMVAVKLNLTSSQLPDSLETLRKSIERSIPLGAGGRNQILSDSVLERAQDLSRSAVYASDTDPRSTDTWVRQLGTLGSGNHFIELCVDELESCWLVLHSGSRGVGNQLAQKHIKIAQQLCDQRFIQLVDRDLAFLIEGESTFQQYIEDLLWSQDFAKANRDEMMDRCLMQLGLTLYKEYGHEKELELERINCHHNFSQKENHFGHNVWITRKGAIQVQQGKLGVIPGSMGTRTYIVEGLGNRQSYCSAPHGAGRRFSRAEARRLYSLRDLEVAMAGIECRVRPELIDEIPGAYKDIDKVMENAKELVTVRHILHQVMNIKGD